MLWYARTDDLIYLDFALSLLTNVPVDALLTNSLSSVTETLSTGSQYESEVQDDSDEVSTASL